MRAGAPEASGPQPAAITRFAPPDRVVDRFPGLPEPFRACGLFLEWPPTYSIGRGAPPHPVTTTTREQPERPSILDLLEQEEFVRNLARKLLGDPHAAEDLVQDTWVRALQSPPRHAMSLRGWLSRVVRNLAANAHSAGGRRPKLAELHEACSRSPSAAEVMARGHLRGELAEALSTLTEDQRDVIVDRHYEDLPPREIALRSAVPVETVRTRYKRGMAHLRARLDREYGEPGAAWMLGLVGGIELPAPPPSGGTPSARGASEASSGSVGELAPEAAIGTATGIATRAAALIGLPLLAISIAAWALIANQTEPQTALAGRPEPLIGAAIVSPMLASNRALAAGPRPVLKPAKLVLTVRERGTNDPVPGLQIQLESLSLPDEPVTTATTDRRGRVTLSKLRPGTYRIRPERGPVVPRTLHDGERAEVELWVPPTRALRGLVIDRHGAPVAGAEVLASWPNEPVRCRRVATSDPDGRFALEAVDPGSWLCARAPGHADTEMRYLADPVHRNEERLLTLQFRFPPARLDGVVVDQDDQPIEGARIQVVRGLSQWSETGIDAARWPEVRLDGTLAVNAPPRKVVTDREGEFLLDSLRLGIHTLAVYADGYAPWQMDVKLDPARPAAVHVALAAETVLRGTLKTPSGHAAENATVSVRSRRPDIARVVYTDRRGRFEVRGLPAGEVDVQAWLVADDEPLHAAAVLDLEAARTAVWEPLLSPGGAIQGLAVDERGEPLAGWFVAIEREDGIGPHGAKTLVSPRPALRQVSTGTDGRFTLPGCKPGFYLVTLFDPDAMRKIPRAWRSGVVPDAEPLRLALGAAASSGLFGTVVTTEDVPLNKLELVVDSLVLPQQLRLPLASDGSFSVEGLAPGRFTLRAWGDGIPLQLFAGGKLAPGEHKDLGALRLEPTGMIELVVRRADGSAPEQMQIKMLVESSKPLFASNDSPLLGFTFGEEGRVHVGPLPRGRYGLRARTDQGEFTVLKHVALRPGQTKRIELELQLAAPREFIFHCPRPAATGSRLASTVNSWRASSSSTRSKQTSRSRWICAEALGHARHRPRGPAENGRASRKTPDGDRFVLRTSACGASTASPSGQPDG